MGSPGAARRASAELTGAAHLTESVRAAYDATAAGWDAGPGPMYAALAQGLVARAGMPLSGRRVLDLGAGTGAVGSAAAAAGARQVVAVDIAARMLARCRGRIWPVAADMAALPFRDDCFDLAIAGFCLGHLGSLPDALREVRRVSAALAASAFAPGWSHPAKNAVDVVLAQHGYCAPAWYQAFKRDNEPRAADPDVLRAAAGAAGFARIEIATIQVETGLETPAQLAAWRLGMAHVASFAAALTPARRAALGQAARAAVAAAGCGSLHVKMLVLTAT